MKGVLAVAAAGFLLAGPALAFGSADATVIKADSRPSQTASADALEWDFGVVKSGSTVRHAFSVTNDTGKPMKITSVATSCGCTVSKAKKEVLGPGESTTLEVSFNSTGYQGKTRQFTYVTTDHVDKPVIRYIIRAEVQK